MVPMMKIRCPNCGFPIAQGDQRRWVINMQTATLRIKCKKCGKSIGIEKK